MFYTKILLTIISFFSGSIMYSYLIPKLIKNVDIRELSEDKNPGSGNVIKYFGVFTGLLCILLDLLKGFIPVYIAINKFNICDIYLSIIATAPILGHAFSPFLNFKGGKAIACTFGSFLALYPLSNIALYFALILVFFKFIITIKPNSSVILISIFILLLIILFSSGIFYIKVSTFFTFIILSYKHKINRNEGDITISLFNKYFITTIYHFN